MTGERIKPTRPPQELISDYIACEGADKGLAQQLSIQLLEHAGITDDPMTSPVIGKDGRQVVHNGEPVVLAGYIDYAADHHFQALEGIFNFLMMDRNAPGFEDERAAVAARVRPANA